jgi:hypothetical protein
MKYTPVNHTPFQLLKKAGFIDAINRGYQLPIGTPKHTDVILANRVHAFIEGDTINFHHDVKGNGKTHKAHSFDLRCKGLYQIFMFIDGQTDKIHPKNRFRRKFAAIISI